MGAESFYPAFMLIQKSIDRKCNKNIAFQLSIQIADNQNLRTPQRLETFFLITRLNSLFDCEWKQKLLFYVFDGERATCWISSSSFFHSNAFSSYLSIKTAKNLKRYRKLWKLQERE